MAVVASAHSRTSEKGEPVEKLEDGGKKRVIRAKHDCWTDQNGISKCSSNRSRRVGVIESVQLDGKRSVILVRRDNVGEGELAALPPRNHLNIYFSPLTGCRSEFFNSGT
jgi:hypothetical protein